ncbi:outer membrane lipoprotein chaperone LolA [Parendozoicomonas haliclonae]|nr:outer membrane lipoprotein chaperone LolA [Parendozoicomonas haliclonae]
MKKTHVLPLALLVACFSLSGSLLAAGEKPADASSAKVTALKEREAADELTRVLKDIQTLQAQFQQTTMDNGGRRLQESSGDMVLKRPNLFRWNVADPFPQEVVSNGQQVSYYDKEMEQITLQDLDLASSATPALLLSGDTAAMLESFAVNMAKTSGNHFFTLLPKGGDSPFQELQLTFVDGRLSNMVLLDSLGSRTKILFDKVVMNEPVKDKLFEQYVPPGIDVLDQRASVMNAQKPASQSVGKP